MKRLILASALCWGLTFAAAPKVGADEVAQGRAYFMRYCASCHGVKADGLGPAASALKERPPDLRRLSEEYGMPLPAERIARFIDGRDAVAAHGSREMPVWGRRFAEIWTAKQEGKAGLATRIDQIVDYLNSIQLAGRPARLPTESGAVEQAPTP